MEGAVNVKNKRELLGDPLIEELLDIVFNKHSNMPINGILDLYADRGKEFQSLIGGIHKMKEEYKEEEAVIDVFLSLPKFEFPS